MSVAVTALPGLVPGLLSFGSTHGLHFVRHVGMIVLRCDRGGNIRRAESFYLKVVSHLSLASNVPGETSSTVSAVRYFIRSVIGHLL